jgi:hypothetical protein
VDANDSCRLTSERPPGVSSERDVLRSLSSGSRVDNTTIMNIRLAGPEDIGFLETMLFEAFFGTAQRNGRRSPSFAGTRTFRIYCLNGAGTATAV